LSSAAYLATIPLQEDVALAFYYVFIKYIILSQSMNLIAGYTGYFDFGHVVWYGLGTYVSAILLRSFPVLGAVAFLVPLAGGIFCAALAALVGLPLLRLRGPYFAISMLVFNESVRTIVILWDWLTAGATGISNPAIFNPIGAYYGMLLLAIGTLTFTWYLARSRFGVGLKAIREDEDAASVMGINTTAYKVTAFSISAFFAGVVGGIDFWYVAYTAPELVFNVVLTIEMVVIMMVGGAGTVFGPVIGTSLLYLVRDYFWARFPALYLMIFGAAIIASVLFMPRGILGVLESRVPVLRGKIK